MLDSALTHPLVLLLLSVVGCYIFLVGFFPEGSHSVKWSSDSDAQKQTKIGLEGPFPRVVFMVIDALRWDFLERNMSMPFLASLSATGHTLNFIAKTESPTVTLPRIKSLVTGAVPEYLDVLDNYHSSRLQADSWVASARAHGSTLVFYGDDTWLKLFPDEFVRSKGVSSFFVNDFTEVDRNVTRHVQGELARSDWDLMVLHYLGLDHIGHLHGSGHPLIDIKLAEMDALIQDIYNKLTVEKDRPPPVLIVCGDHGMSSSGGHGGSSYPETHTALRFISPVYSANKQDGRSARVSTVQQTDVAATVAALRGLPAPAASEGALIADVVRPLGSAARTLHLLLLNARQLARLCRSRGHTALADAEELLVERVASEAGRNQAYAALRSTQSIIIACISRMKLELAVVERNHDPVAMFVGFSVVLLSGVVSRCRRHGTTRRWLAAGLTYCGLLTTVRLLYCHLAASDGGRLCSARVGHVSWLAVASLTSLLTAVTLTRRPQLTSLHRVGWAHLPALLLTGYAVQLISLFASSFVEEEHQAWYQLLGTAALWLTYRDSQQWRYLRLSPSLLLLLVGAGLRRWNRAGDKWRHLPAARDYLRGGGDVQALVVDLIAVAALVLLSCDGVLSWQRRRFQLLPLLSAGCQLLQQLTVGGVWPARVALLLVGVGHVMLKRRPLDAWLWLGATLVRPDNLPAWVGVAVQMALVRRLMDSHRDAPPTPLLIALLHHCTGAAGFFYMGNSNSPATVDIASGYVLSEAHSTVEAVLLTVCHTYLAPVLATLSALHVAQRSRSWRETLSWLVTLRCVGLAVYMVVASCFVRHLFVWTVFTPKLLYEALSIAVFTVVCSLAAVISRTAESKGCTVQL